MTTATRKDPLISLAAARLNLQAQGVHVSHDTLRVWARKGICGGIKLETVRIGRRWHTRPSWLAKFLERCQGIGT